MSAITKEKDVELATNAEYRTAAIQPMVNALFEISLKLDTVNMLLMTQNDLLAELIKRS
jgi:hypothetical protein